MLGRKSSVKGRTVASRYLSSSSISQLDLLPTAAAAVHGTGKQKQRPALSSNTSNVVKRPSNTTVIAVATAQSLSKPVDAVKVNTHHTVNAAGKEQSAAAMKKQQLVELQADYLRTVYSLHRSRQSLAELRKTTEYRLTQLTDQCCTLDRNVCELEVEIQQVEFNSTIADRIETELQQMVEYEKDMNEFLPRYNRIVDTLVAAANSLPVQDVVLTAEDAALLAADIVLFNQILGKPLANLPFKELKENNDLSNLMDSREIDFNGRLEQAEVLLDRLTSRQNAAIISNLDLNQ